MLKKILFVLVAAVVALVGVISSRPSTFSLQRSATIQAPPEVVFAQVNDFHNWDGWSPWSKLDPTQKVTFEGPESGKGAMYGWSGNDQVGEGRMTIEESQPNERVRIKLEFIKPWAATNTTTFLFHPAGDGVTVTWRMEGINDFMGKAFSLFMDMDAMVGKDFEKGLAAMKAVAETEAKKQAEEALAKAAAAAPPAAESQPATAAPPAP